MSHFDLVLKVFRRPCPLRILAWYYEGPAVSGVYRIKVWRIGVAIKSDLIHQKLFSGLCLLTMFAGIETSVYSRELKTQKTQEQANWYQSNQRLFDAGKYQDVLKNLSDVLKTGSDEAKRQFLLARTFAKLKRYPDAAMAASKAFELDQRMHLAKFNEACYLAQAGHLLEAWEALEKLELVMFAAGTAKTRLQVGTALKNDPDLEALRKNEKYKDLVGNLSEAFISDKERKMQFKGCALKDQKGAIEELKHFNCQDFDGARFSGPAYSCSKPWVKINEAVPVHMVQSLDECIYEL